MAFNRFPSQAAIITYSKLLKEHRQTSSTVPFVDFVGALNHCLKQVTKENKQLPSAQQFCSDDVYSIAAERAFQQANKATELTPNIYSIKLGKNM